MYIRFNKIISIKINLNKIDLFSQSKNLKLSHKADSQPFPL